jgi:signal recognition particle receptor subunit beta
MGTVNFHTKEIQLKIVYYGPGLGGKTTTLQFIHNSIPEHKRSPLLALDTETERTLHFDFLPVALTQLRGFDLRLQLYTVPGQVFYGAIREIVLRGADAIVFVADSQTARQDGNRISLEDLQQNLARQGVNLEHMPMVIQYNKRDLADISPIEELEAQLNPFKAPWFPTVATQGEGILDSLKTISRLALRDYSKKNLLRP